ncbi:PAS domain-containing protein [Caulobacter sp. 17J65-9]|uniref:PAS domain-containing protein n=1 Tax=Caulobacter sp. 17J65-9 TaxID=2709382 RepID=UPI0013C896DD|nr:PAS domain-containing protein [Caulobacter sp. 17J65-9]NEX94759.1 PAS domain S-box protein [Caulobacter sp. 17J65-9]
MSAPSEPVKRPGPSAEAVGDALFRALIEGAPVKMWIGDPDGEPFGANAAWRRYTGEGDDEKPLWIDVIHPDERAAAIEIRTRALAERRTYELVARLRRADGAWRWHRAKISPIHQDGAVVAWVGSAMDIHDVREAEARFRGLADTLPALIFETDAGGGNIFVNERFQAFTGLPVEALSGDGWLDTLHDEDRPKAARRWARAVESGANFEVEYRVRRRDGVFRWHLVRGTPIRDEEGRIDRWIGACVDIDDQKQAAEQLRESVELFRTLAAAIPQLAWRADAQGSVYWFNQRWYDYTGGTPADMEGQGWRRVHHPDHLERVVEGYVRACKAGESWRDTFPLRGRDGRYRWFLAQAEPMRDADGKVVSWLGTNTDVTERVEAEQLQALLGREISHRVKNSLALVSGLLTMQARDLEGEPRIALTEASLRVTTVARLHDLLWRSASARTVDLAAMALELCEGLATTAPLHTLNCAAEPVQLSTDQAIPLALMINELVTNAFKHAYPEGEGGPVDVAVALRDGRLTVEVRDHGAGLPAGFDLHRRHTSLGMKVITALAQQLGADLVAEQAEPGARFRLTMTSPELGPDRAPSPPVAPASA